MPGPLRAGKAWLYEGGIPVRLFIKFPGRVKPELKSRACHWNRFVSHDTRSGKSSTKEHLDGKV